MEILINCAYYELVVDAQSAQCASSCALEELFPNACQDTRIILILIFNFTINGVN